FAHGTEFQRIGLSRLLACGESQPCRRIYAEALRFNSQRVGPHWDERERKFAAVVRRLLQIDPGILRDEGYYRLWDRRACGIRYCSVERRGIGLRPCRTWTEKRHPGHKNHCRLGICDSSHAM